MTVEYDTDDCATCGARCRAGTGSSGPGTALFVGVVSINVCERVFDPATGRAVDLYENRRVCSSCARVVKDALMELLGFEFPPLSAVPLKQSPHQNGQAMDVPASTAISDAFGAIMRHGRSGGLNIQSLPVGGELSLPGNASGGCNCGSSQPNNIHPVFHHPGCPMRPSTARSCNCVEPSGHTAIFHRLDCPLHIQSSDL